MYSQSPISGSTLIPNPPTVSKHKNYKPKVVDGVIQKCARPLCQTVFTPQWRLGPTGERNYCNACGLNYAKDCRTGIRTPVVQKISNMSNSVLTVTVEATYTPEEKKTRKKMQISKLLN